MPEIAIKTPEGWRIFVAIEMRENPGNARLEIRGEFSQRIDLNLRLMRPRLFVAFDVAFHIPRIH